MSGILDNIVFAIIVLLILFGVSHFVKDVYIMLYRMYYDSRYFTKLSNGVKQFKAKYLPF